MNAEPHVHELSMREHRSTGALEMTYGDQRKYWLNSPRMFRGFRLERAAKRLVRKHDRESIKAGKREVIDQRILSSGIPQKVRSKWSKEEINVVSG